MHQKLANHHQSTLMKNYKFLALVILTSVILVSLAPELALARAGGGRSKGGGILGIILLPFAMIYLAILRGWIKTKSKEAALLLEKISKLDNHWDAANLQHTVKQAFFKIQDAWMNRDQGIAREYMTQKLYDLHRIQTDRMLAQKRKNVMEAINLSDVKIVEVMDSKEDSKDYFWAFISGSMIDYEIDEFSNKVTDGDKKSRSFSELWKFCRSQNSWLADEIDSEVSISDLKRFESKSDVA